MRGATDISPAVGIMAWCFIQFSRCWWEAGSRWGRPPNCPMRSAEGEKVRPAPLFDRWGRKALDLFGRGENRREGIFLPVRKSPFTNTAKSPLFCSPKVNISLYLMESLQNWGLLGENCINSGLYWGSEAGNYYDILGRRGVAARGCGTTICRGMGSRRNSRPSW